MRLKEYFNYWVDHVICNNNQWRSQKLIFGGAIILIYIYFLYILYMIKTIKNRNEMFYYTICVNKKIISDKLNKYVSLEKC
jgi:hypothetical protein